MGKEESDDMIMIRYRARKRANDYYYDGQGKIIIRAAMTLAAVQVVLPPSSMAFHFVTRIIHGLNFQDGDHRRHAIPLSYPVEPEGTCL